MKLMPLAFRVVLLGILALLPALAAGDTPPPAAVGQDARNTECCGCSWTGRAADFLCTARDLARLAWRVTRDLVRDAAASDVSVAEISAGVVKQIAFRGAANWLTSAPLGPQTIDGRPALPSPPPVPAPLSRATALLSVTP